MATNISYLPYRISSKIEQVTESGCWIWIAYTHKQGYGRVSINNKVYNAHRVVYETLRGPIGYQLELDHLCRVRCCVNPDHLEAVTHKENVLRGNGIMASYIRRTHCKRGHPLQDSNKYFMKNGYWRCRACRVTEK